MEVICFSEMVIPPSFKLAREACNEKFSYDFIWGSCLGFVSYEVGWVFLYLFFQSGKLFTDGMEVGICKIVLLDYVFDICEGIFTR
jgi:hypothetical protein